MWSPNVCKFCGEPITKLSQGHVEIYNAPAMSYPRSPDHLVVCMSHTKCGPDRGYHLTFARLLAESLEDWFAHLRTKPWWAETYEHDLTSIYRYVEQLSRRRDEIKAPPAKRIEALEVPPRRKRNPARDISLRTRKRIFARDRYRCRHCGHGPEDGAKLVIDHIVAVARGGDGSEQNLQTLCRDCNAGKSDDPPEPHDLVPATHRLPS